MRPARRQALGRIFEALRGPFASLSAKCEFDLQIFNYL